MPKITVTVNLIPHPDVEKAYDYVANLVVNQLLKNPELLKIESTKSA